MNSRLFLYHGTSASAAQAALRDGIKPRGEHGRTNWKRTIESNPETVYLTDAYPIYFALNASRDDKGAVIQIDVDKLDQLWLVPDEDVLEQAGRKHDDVPGNMKQRTRFYRNHMRDYVASNKWLTSLKAMGTCGFMGTIPPEAITRVAFIDFDQCRTLAVAAGDAMICLANYRFCQAKYRNLTNRLFGLAQEPDDLQQGMIPEPTADMDEATRLMLGQMAKHRRDYEEALAADISKVQFVENLAAAA